MSEGDDRNLLGRALDQVQCFLEWSGQILRDPAVRDSVLADLGMPGGKKSEITELPEPSDPIEGIDDFRKTADPDAEAFRARLADLRRLGKVILDGVQRTRTEGAGAVLSSETLEAVFHLLSVHFVFRRWPIVYWIAQPLGLLADLNATDPVHGSFWRGARDFFTDKPGGPRLRDDWLAALGIAVALSLEILAKSDPVAAKKLRVLYGWESGRDSPTPVGDRIAQRALSVRVDLGAGTLTTTLLEIPPALGQAGTLLAFSGSGRLTNTSGGWRHQIELSGASAFSVFFPVTGDPVLDGPVDARLIGSLERRVDPTAKPHVIPIRGGTRIEVGRFLTSVGISRAGFEARLVALKSAFVLEAGDDPLLQRGLKSGSLRAEFDLGLGYANGKLFLEGGGGLQATLPAQRAIGPVTLRSITLGVRSGSKPEDRDLNLEASVSIQLKLGAATLTLDRIGCKAFLDFGGDGKKTDGGFDFQPPLGVGITIDADCIEGGGYIGHDPKLDQYVGVVQLKLGKQIDLKAIALLTRKIGDRPAFSLLLIITAEGFRPIPLALGFKLTGVGGIFGVDRAMNLPALEAGVKTKALDSLLFPKDPVGNAARIVAVAGAVFPPTPDRCVLGPMVRLTWGADQLVTIDLAVLFELVGISPRRIAILGKARTALPKEGKRKALQIEIDLVGTIDRDQKRAFAHAVITTGKIGTFTLSGEAALLYTWGDKPFFILSIGGFNPRYQKPADFPALERVKFSLAAKKNLSVDATFYVAVTSNSFQIGGSLYLVAKKSKFTLKGGLAIDALIQSQQPCYAFDLRASIELLVWGEPLFAVRLEGTLLGDRPWTVSGKATFEIWIFDYTVDFSHTWGDAEPEAPPPEVDVGPEVIFALSDPRSWTAELPTGARNPVALRRVAGTETRLHPLGSLSVAQRVVPLGVPLTRFGNSRLSGQSLFRIDRVSVGGVPVETDPVKEPFALAQFVDMTDDEKIGSPAFESHPAGVRLRSAPLANGPAVEAGADYKTLVYDPAQGKAVEKAMPTGAAPPVFLRSTLAFRGAASRRAVRLAAPGWTVAAVDTQAPEAEAAPATFLASFAALRARPGGPRRSGFQLLRARGVPR